MIALNLAMYANPIGLIVLAVAALVAGVVILELKFHLVTRAVRATYDVMKDLVDLIRGHSFLGQVLKIAGGSLPTIGPFVGALADGGTVIPPDR
jgi:hypothetical protein